MVSSAHRTKALEACWLTSVTSLFRYQAGNQRFWLIFSSFPFFLPHPSLLSARPYIHSAAAPCPTPPVHHVENLLCGEVCVTSAADLRCALRLCGGGLSSLSDVDVSFSFNRLQFLRSQRTFKTLCWSRQIQWGNSSYGEASTTHRPLLLRPLPRLARPLQS